MAYAFQKEENKEQLAFARVDGVNASYRDLCNVCSNIKGRRTDKAVAYLEEALLKKRPIRYFRHNKHRGHLHELGGKKGGFPVKSVGIVLAVLKNAVANADVKGLGDCKVVHACANKQLVYARMSAKGRRIRQDFETAFVEIVVRELQTPENLAKKEEKRKAVETAKAKAEEAKKAADAKKAEAARKTDDKTEEKSDAKKEAPKAEAKSADKKSEAKKEEVKEPLEKKAAPQKKKMSEVLAEQKAASKDGESKN